MEDVNNFCRRYQATVGLSGERIRRARPLTDTFKGAIDFNYQDIPMVKVVMPEDNFRALIENQNYIQQLIGRIPDSYSGYMYKDIAMQIVEREDAEIRLRNQHPGLKDLYNQYQMMLTLVK